MKAAELFGGGMGKGESSGDAATDDEDPADEKSVREGYGKQAMTALKSGDVPGFTEAITKLCKLASEEYDEGDEGDEA